MANAKYLNLRRFLTGPCPHNAGVEGSSPSLSTSLPAARGDQVEGVSPKIRAKPAPPGSTHAILLDDTTGQKGKRPPDHEMTQPLPAFHCCAIFSPLASDRNAGIAKVLISSMILPNPSMSSSSPIFLTKAFH